MLFLSVGLVLCRSEMVGGRDDVAFHYYKNGLI